MGSEKTERNCAVSKTENFNTVVCITSTSFGIKVLFLLQLRLMCLQPNLAKLANRPRLQNTLPFLVVIPSLPLQFLRPQLLQLSQPQPQHLRFLQLLLLPCIPSRQNRPRPPRLPSLTNLRKLPSLQNQQRLLQRVLFRFQVNNPLCPQRHL